MSAGYFEYAMGHVRLSLLLALLESPSRAANDSILATAMGTLGLPVTRDQVRTQLGWLEEQQLIRLTRPKDTVIVAALRERGGEVALGLSSVEGVQRPSVAR